jgi:hypothetical protein
VTLPVEAPPPLTAMPPFASTPTSWHSVARVTGPQPRRSLALFGYRDCPGNVTRPRSLFAAAPGEDESPRAEAARKDRSR